MKATARVKDYTRAIHDIYIYTYYKGYAKGRNRDQLEVELVQLVVAALAMLAIMLHHHLRPLMNCWCQMNAGSVAGFAT